MSAWGSKVDPMALKCYFRNATINGRRRTGPVIRCVPDSEVALFDHLGRSGQQRGGTPAIRAANGGLDANWMVRHAVPTVTFGAGQNKPHTIDEWINLDEYERACALAVQLATMR
jgi:di/tripeptidase